MVRNKRSHCNEKRRRCNEAQPPLAAIRESPCKAMKTQHSQNKKSKQDLGTRCYCDFIVSGPFRQTELRNTPLHTYVSILQNMSSYQCLQPWFITMWILQISSPCLCVPSTMRSLAFHHLFSLYLIA